MKSTVAVAASGREPMTPEEVGRVDPALGVQLLPMTAGSIVITYNLPDVKDLRLSRQAY